jgi:hypothetical protein
MQKGFHFIAKKRKNMKVQNTPEEKLRLKKRYRVENFSRFRLWAVAREMLRRRKLPSESSGPDAEKPSGRVYLVPAGAGKTFSLRKRIPPPNPLISSFLTSCQPAPSKPETSRDFPTAR